MGVKGGGGIGCHQRVTKNLNTAAIFCESRAAALAHLSRRSREKKTSFDISTILLWAVSEPLGGDEMLFGGKGRGDSLSYCQRELKAITGATHRRGDAGVSRVLLRRGLHLPPSDHTFLFSAGLTL